MKKFQYLLVLLAVGCITVSAQTFTETINLNVTSQYGGDYTTDNSYYTNVLAIGGTGAETGLKIYKQNSGNSSTFIGPTQWNDAYVFEMTDANGTNPDGGVIFGGTGNDDIFEGILTIKGDGNVGIGTNSPGSRLDVNGRIKSEALSISGYNPISTVNGFKNKMEFIGYNGAIALNPGQAEELMFGLHSNGNFYWGTGGTGATNPNYYSMYLNGNNGNLGIKGKLTSNEVKVKVGGWADYVFKESYNLPTLEEVEKHIKEKGHLINIPSAKEVEENGIQLGEMNKLLLEKIEELTLYTIQQQKEIVQLKTENAKMLKLEDELQEMRKLISKITLEKK